MPDALLFLDLALSRIRVSGGLVKAILRGGFVRVKLSQSCAFSRHDDSRPGLGRNGHEGKPPKGRPGSARAKLAVTAMLVIASFIFYCGGKHRNRRHVLIPEETRVGGVSKDSAIGNEPIAPFRGSSKRDRPPAITATPLRGGDD